MKKEIHFAGINVVPTDHDAQDGMLEAAYNLLPERSGPSPLSCLTGRCWRECRIR